MSTCTRDPNSVSASDEDEDDEDEELEDWDDDLLGMQLFFKSLGTDLSEETSIRRAPSILQCDRHILHDIISVRSM